MKLRLSVYCLSFLFFFSLIGPSLAQYRMGEEKPTKIQKKKKIKKKKYKKKIKRKTKKKKARQKKSFKPWPSKKGSSQEPLIKSDAKEEAPPVLDEDPYLSNLSRQFEIPKKKLEYLRSIKHGYREIVKGLIVSRDAQVEVGRVLNLRVNGESWERISERFFINKSDFSKEANMLLKPFKKRLPSERIEQRPSRRK